MVSPNGVGIHVVLKQSFRDSLASKVLRDKDSVTGLWKFWPPAVRVGGSPGTKHYQANDVASSLSSTRGANEGMRQKTAWEKHELDSSREKMEPKKRR